MAKVSEFMDEINPSLLVKTDEEEISCENSDRISELPDPICHHILSFLPQRDVRKTYFLSRRWRYMWYTNPSYEFSERDFGITEKQAQKIDPLQVQVLKFAGKTLKQRKRYFSDLTIEKFSISMYYFYEYRSFLTKWIAFARNSNVKELNIIGLFEKPLFIPRTMLEAFQNSCITTLEIVCGYFERKPVSWNLPCLQKLIFRLCNLSDWVIEEIFSNSPAIKTAHLYRSNIIKRGEIIVSNETLTEFQVSPSGSGKIVVVDAPNLESFSCGESVFDYVENVRIVSCRALRSLTLRKINLMTDSMLEDVLGKNNQLEKLHLEYCWSLNNLVISSPKLLCLRLINCLYLFALEINTPSLEKLEFKGRLITFTTIITSSLLVAEIDIQDSYVSHFKVWYTKLKDLCQKLGECKKLSLAFLREEDFIFPAEWRKKLRPCVCNLEHLKILIQKRRPHNHKLLEGGAHWIFPSLRTLDIEYSWKDLRKYHYYYSYRAKKNIHHIQS